MADDVKRPQQVVLDLKWTEDGQERRELFGPWTQGDPETEEGGLAHMAAAHAFLRQFASVRDPGRTAEATVIIVSDPDEWMRPQEQKGSDGD